MKNEAATTAVDYKYIKVSSTEFRHNDLIPSKYTCEGINVSPPLDLEHIPADAVSLVLIVDDPDAPKKTWVHWIVWNMPVTHHIKEKEAHGIAGITDFRKNEYGGPCPPSGTHRYFFKVYALNRLLDLPVSTDKPALEKAMSDSIIGFGELIGLYQKKAN